MPHLVILYTGQLDAETDMKLLCRSLADAMLSVRDEENKQVIELFTNQFNWMPNTI